MSWAVGPVYAAVDCSAVSFNSAPTFDVGKNPSAAAIGDFNNDGAPDLAVANYGSDTFSIMNGDGTGAFAPPRSFPVGILDTNVSISPRAVATGDFNGDGKLDLVVVGGYNSGWVSVLIGDGKGSFAAPLNLTTGAHAYAVVVGDFNGDSKKDIAVAGGDSRKISFLLGNGAGGFALAGNVAVVSDSLALTVADFNGDGISDVAAIGGYGNWNVSIIPGKSSGAFAVSNTFTVHWPPYSISSADFNNDGKADLVVAISFSTPAHGIAVMLGDGAGGFGTANEIFTGYEPTSVVTGDFNSDSKADIAVVVSASNNVAVLTGDGAGNFASPKYFGTASGPFHLTAGDVNKDGKTDLISTHFNSHRASVLLGTGTGDFATTTTLLDGGAQVASADFNGDNLPDLAIPIPNYFNSSSVGIFINNGAGGFAPPYYYQLTHSAKTVVIKDFNNDGKMDLAVAHEYSGTVSVLLGTGTGSFNVTSTPVVSNGLGLMVGGDFNNDNKVDLAVLSANNGGSVAIMKGIGTGSFAAPSYITIGGAPSGLTTGDFSGDGKLDLAITNSYLGTLTVLLGNGAGGFSAAPYSPINAAGNADIGNKTINSVTAADLNKDGRIDLVTANVEAGTVSVLLNNGSGFAPVVTYNTGTDPRTVRVADFNADGNPDLAVAMNSYDGNIAVLTGDGAGNFKTPFYFTAGSAANDLAVADYNNDGKPDLAVPNVTVLLNTFKAQPCLSVSDVTMTEADAGTTNAVFTIKLSAASTQTVKVNYFLKENTAQSGVDYKPLSDRLVFAPGVTTRSISVPVVGDRTDEFDEDFTFLLSNPSNAVIGRGQAVGTIVDNDLPPTISIKDESGAEGHFPGSAYIPFTATLSAPSAKQISVQFITANGTAIAGSDYNASSPQFITVYFLPGATTVRLGVSIIGDFAYEPNETFFLDLANPTNATIARARAQGTIVNDDPLPAISTYGDIVINEGNSGIIDIPIFLQLSNPSAQTITVKYATADGTALAGSDYVASTGTITFLPGENAKTLFLQVKGDALTEPDETFLIKLSNQTNATIVTAQKPITLLNDDVFRLLTEDFTNEAIAFDSVTMLRDPFPLTTLFNFSADHRTRITLIAGNLSLLPGENASAVMAQAEDAQHRVYPLVVEDVRKVPDFDWMTQVTVVLPDELKGVGNILMSLNYHGTSTNKVFIRIKP